MNSNNRIGATLFPRDIVCLRNISKNILHKVGDDDNNNNKQLKMAYVIGLLSTTGIIPSK
jgi:hypothetical protein